MWCHEPKCRKYLHAAIVPEIQSGKLVALCWECYCKLINHDPKDYKSMGNKFEITVWKKTDDLGYHDEQYWRGESFIKAFFHFVKAKREGYGCVSFIWR